MKTIKEIQDYLYPIIGQTTTQLINSHSTTYGKTLIFTLVLHQSFFRVLLSETFRICTSIKDFDEDHFFKYLGFRTFEEKIMFTDEEKLEYLMTYFS